MISVSKARKIIGKEAETMTDSDIEKELETLSFIAELVLEKFKDSSKNYERTVQ